MEILFVGQNLIRLKTVDSTNDFTKRLLKDSTPPEGTVVIAEFQQKGRGQRGMQWIAEQGKNLTFSLLLYPGYLSADQQFNLSKAVALGVLDFVKKRVGGKVSIKWPNDIYIDHSKVAGILIENTLKGNTVGSSIIGIGLNLNQTFFPEELANPTSLTLETGNNFDLDRSLRDLCKFLEVRLLQLKSDLSVFDEEYQNNLYCLNQWRWFDCQGQSFYARITGVNEQGKLALEHQDGTLHYYELKTINFLQKASEDGRLTY